ncbi:MAG: hypothetical protein SNJ68_09820 [Cyanobacteriota bacterium]
MSIVVDSSFQLAHQDPAARAIGTESSAGGHLYHPGLAAADLPIMTFQWIARPSHALLEAVDPELKQWKVIRLPMCTGEGLDSEIQTRANLFLQVL